MLQRGSVAKIESGPLRGAASRPGLTVPAKKTDGIAGLGTRLRQVAGALATQRMGLNTPVLIGQLVCVVPRTLKFC